MPLKSEELFKKMSAGIEKYGPEIVPKVQCVYAFELKEKKSSKPVTFTIDLKNGKGEVRQGKIEGVKADATFVMLDEDFVKLSQGKLKPQMAFMQGKMKIKGNMKAALKFKPSMFPKDAKL
mmetsp:Transcript_13241/g.22471  ORF Transcript_13241/g.22471 Transcript_13241/m.22471 type:complete len:121 (-) Transcript_13241:44-406(-)|eukprot:CAMPEP_0168628198 /NCGR_PEP_ID=MMETSP0449_2-20121227/11713_1 /TAXON_ID=1082188 /ORGANISM="Strombidium rassoulzadegani, Strain ras09" /LENGTH=120 /DNA_ID=CAMNT_0008670595 /DNA_START=17 /DNA_END=379 /DNA_ORIENTATION=+